MQQKFIEDEFAINQLCFKVLHKKNEKNDFASQLDEFEYEKSELRALNLETYTDFGLRQISSNLCEYWENPKYTDKIKSFNFN